MDWELDVGQDGSVRAQAETRAESAMRTRSAILSAARRLVVDRGFEAVSLREVAEAAGISHPGLQKHFPSKALLLVAVLEECATPLAEPRTVDALLQHVRDVAADPVQTRLEVSLAVAGWDEEHPAHDWYDQLHRWRERVVGRLLVDDVVAIDHQRQVRRLVAIWEGQQVISAYLPDQPSADVVLKHSLAPSRAAEATTAYAQAPVDHVGLATIGHEEHEGYAPGRQRRERIISAAVELFATQGFHATTLNEVAAQVGSSASTLRHYFGSKEDLLTAVLRHRDAELVLYEKAPTASATQILRSAGDDARRDEEQEPGLIALYATMSCEAVVSSHPAHDYFSARFARTLAYFENLLHRAALEGGLLQPSDARLEASTLVALWDGLQRQWMADPLAVDIGAELDTHLAGLLNPDQAHST